MCRVNTSWVNRLIHVPGSALVDSWEEACSRITLVPDLLLVVSIFAEAAGKQWIDLKILI